MPNPSSNDAELLGWTAGWCHAGRREHHPVVVEAGCQFVRYMLLNALQYPVPDIHIRAAHFLLLECYNAAAQEIRRREFFVRKTEFS